MNMPTLRNPLVVLLTAAALTGSPTHIAAQGEPPATVTALGGRAISLAEARSGTVVMIRTGTGSLPPDHGIWSAVRQMHVQRIHHGVTFLCILQGPQQDAPVESGAQLWAEARGIAFPVILEGAGKPLGFGPPKDSISVQQPEQGVAATLPLVGKVTPRVLRLALGLDESTPQGSTGRVPEAQEPRPEPPSAEAAVVEASANRPKPAAAAGDRPSGMFDDWGAVRLTPVAEGVAAPVLGEVAGSNGAMVVLLASWDRDAPATVSAVQRVLGATEDGVPRVSWLLLETGPNDAERRKTAVRFAKAHGLGERVWVASAAMVRRLPAPRRLPQVVLLNEQGTMTGRCGSGDDLEAGLIKALGTRGSKTKSR